MRYVRLLFRMVFSTGMLLLLAGAAVLLSERAGAATYASVVMDARNGKILYSRNADMRLHPASLTKMMTVYVAIQAVENGEINLDTRVRISKFAASEPPSKMHLRAGSRVKLRYLIRAAAVRSANDAATAIAEAISGSEREFAARMTRTAQAMGLTKTTFRNAHGLTQKGHLSSARDMTILGRHIIYDYPEYYHLFSKRTANVGGTQVRNTNRRFLRNYSGADGIKTGFTNSAGYNLTASAERGDERIIVTVFGGRSVTTRDRHVAELMDKGFSLAHSNVRVRPPVRPYFTFGKMKRIDTTVETATRRLRRPASSGSDDNVVAEVILASMGAGQGDADPAAALEAVADEGQLALPFARPPRRPGATGMDGEAGIPPNGINLGRFPTKHAADRHLMKVALMEFSTLALARKDIRHHRNAFEARFVGMSPQDAQKACARLTAQSVGCDLLRTE